jgi:large subunit ribosomal protein L15
MKLDEIMSAAGRNKRKKRLGRGRSTGCGKTSGRGQKGMGARAGAPSRAGYEGGQNSQVRRLPKRGFTNIFAKVVDVVNVSDLNKAFEDGATVNAEALLDKGLIERKGVLVKVLGNGELQRKLTVSVNRVSKSAQEKITAAGGTVELLA